jgi:hypothetical protein
VRPFIDIIWGGRTLRWGRPVAHVRADVDLSLLRRRVSRREASPCGIVYIHLCLPGYSVFGAQGIGDNTLELLTGPPDDLVNRVTLVVYGDGLLPLQARFHHAAHFVEGIAAWVAQVNLNPGHMVG